MIPRDLIKQMGDALYNAAFAAFCVKGRENVWMADWAEEDEETFAAWMAGEVFLGENPK